MRLAAVVVRHVDRLHGKLVQAVLQKPRTQIPAPGDADIGRDPPSGKESRKKKTAAWGEKTWGSSYEKQKTQPRRSDCGQFGE